jgi:AraC-like DNA-binding protein
MPQPISTAQYFPWDGGAIFVGTAGEIPAHAHHAIQICFLFEGRIRLRADAHSRWADYDVAIVPSQQPHSMHGGEVHFGATIFVEPETREGRVLAERYLRSDDIAGVERGSVDVAIRELRAAAVEQRGARAVIACARGVVQALTQHAEPSVASDERVLRAVKYVNENLAGPLTLERVAKVAFLSPSRFRHLFVEQTGMGLREYILWRRLVSVWERRMEGASLSEAAHAAGFADSAHLTRTSRSMLGLPPSLLDIDEPHSE